MPVSYQGLLSGLLALTEQTHAPHSVWSGSTSKPVQFTPLPKKAAMRLWQYAREFDRQTKEKGCHGGAIGPGVRIEGGSSLEAVSQIVIDTGAKVGSFCKILDNHFHPVGGSDRFRRPPSRPGSAPRSGL